MFDMISSTIKKTILVVDDTPNNLHLLFKYLNNLNYKILLAQNGNKAIKIAESIVPDLILLDVIMPELDGFSVCRILKANPVTNNIPIIFMTALTDVQNKLTGLELGAIDYITKPIEEQELQVRIKNHLSLTSLNKYLIKDAIKQKIIFEISDRIRQSLDIDIVLKTATSEIRSFLDCDSVMLAQLDDQNVSIKASDSTTSIDLQKIETAISNHFFCPDFEKRQDEKCTECLFSNLSCHQFHLQGDIRIFENVQNDQEEYDSNIQLVAPILINSASLKDSSKDHDYLWGWLIAEQHHSPRKWQLEEINLLKELTTQLAIGIKQGLMHQKLAQMTLLDSLTHIHNRRYFDRQLNLEWRRLKRISSPISLIMLDVDCFKIYNDTYGHQAGDRCLQQLAKAISTALKRPGDVLARYGGEEFGVILPHTSQYGARKVAETIRFAVKKLNIPHINSLVDSVVTISSGIATSIPLAQDNPQLLIEAADLALYQSKERGRDCISVYSKPISHAKDRQDLTISWIKRLRQALTNNLFSLYAQPIKPLNINDTKEYYEILLRLTDEKDQVILPGLFIDIAEQNCFMSEIDTWVINNVLKTLENLDRNNWQNYRFAINLSGESLNSKSFIEFLFHRFTNSNLPGHLFCFEITETVAISNLATVMKFINSMKNLGCCFALDDFGKGMSSLTYLKNLPVDYLKIDGSFIKELDSSHTSKVVVQAINYIAEEIGLKTVAEFVENQTIFNNVKNLNIDYAQGFHLGRPEVLIKAIS